MDGLQYLDKYWMDCSIEVNIGWICNNLVNIGWIAAFR